MLNNQGFETKNLQMTAPKSWEQFPMCWNNAQKEKTCIGCFTSLMFCYGVMLKMLNLLVGCKYTIYDLTTHYPFFMAIVCWGCEPYMTYSVSICRKEGCQAKSGSS